MEKRFYLSLFLFNRDIRLRDNTALINALENSNNVMCAYIFDDANIDLENNSKYKLFLKNSLIDLKTEIEKMGGRLYLFKGSLNEVLNDIFNEVKIDAIYQNKDYSPYAKTRKNSINDFCVNLGVDYLEYSDYVLVNPEVIYSGSGKRYQIFTYFYKSAMTYQVKKMKENDNTNYYNKNLRIDESKLFELSDNNENLFLFENGGRERGLVLLNNLINFEKYSEIRNFPDIDGTTRLSAYLNLGCLSIREVYEFICDNFGRDHDLIRQLYWRDFYTYLAIHFEYVFEKSFNKKYQNIRWKNDSEEFEKWKKGETGFPIVDAGMRQLNTTGYMHNRVRMIVASFLVKDLHIDWRWGERYFAEKLIDYDIMLNNGNWQWAASTGADAQPYFRIFNPWSQQKKFDKDTKYIKKYISELSHIDPKIIHKLEIQRPLEELNYPRPMINHKIRANEAKEMFKFV